MDKKTSDYVKQADRFKVKESSRRRKNDRSSQRKWTAWVTISTFFISVVLSLAASSLLENVNIFVSFVILFVFVTLNVVFDAIGTAATAAEKSVFNSMAARRVKGAKSAIFLLKNADKVSNICCDVIGDIAGIFTGTTTATIAAIFILRGGLYATLGPIILTALSAALTIGGKAIGKNLAIYNANTVIYVVSFLISGFFEDK